MKEVIEESLRLLEKEEPHVLATVVRTKGMTPQKAGAKQLFRKDGTAVGTLGGGCVEGDIWYYANEILRHGDARPELKEYTLNEDMAARDGLVCGGTMYFLVEPLLQQNEVLSYTQEIVGATQGAQPVALATVIKTSGPNLKVGTRFLVRQDGSVHGSINNPKLENQLVQVGKRIAPLGKNELIQTDDGVEIYIESFTTPPMLVIMGGGHVGKTVYELALTLGFSVIIVDDREEFSNKERFPKATQTVVDNFDNALDSLDLNFNTFILIATRGHRFDDMATKAAVPTPARYIGLLGSRRKNLLIFRKLLNHGISIDKIKEIHAPVGLDIGALTPEELAVSIMGEMIMVLRGGEGIPMKMSAEDLTKLLEKED